jgi:ABC-type uncharacterized transport system auxiliary subunit
MPPVHAEVNHDFDRATVLCRADIQAFTAPAESRCIVQLSASLWRSTDQIVAQRVFRSELPAQTPDARGAVVCLASAVNLESDEIVEWLSAEIAGTPSGEPARR